MENEHDDLHPEHPENGEGDGGRKRPPVRTRPVEARVGEEVRRLRLAAGLTQHDLALGARMSNSYISRLEAGEVNPTVEALHRIARIFGTTIDAIVVASLAKAERRASDSAPTQSPTHSVDEVGSPESFNAIATSSLLGSDEIDPEVKIWLFRLRGKRISGKAKRIIRTVIEEELKELDEQGG